jgi:CHAD domain-containing protein
MKPRETTPVTADRTQAGAQTFRQAGIAWMREQNRRLQERLPGTLEGKDPEELHQMRVASRRLRAAMLVFEPLFAPRLFRKWYRRVSAITDALGAARDADVQMEAVRRRQLSMTARESADVDVWLLVHFDRRAAARARMEKALAEWRDRDMSGRFSGVLRRLGRADRVTRRATRLAETLCSGMEGRNG